MQAACCGEVSMVLSGKKIKNQELLIRCDDAALPVGNRSQSSSSELLLDYLYRCFFVAALHQAAHLGLHRAGREGVVFFICHTGVGRGCRCQGFPSALKGPCFYPIGAALRWISGIAQEGHRDANSEAWPSRRGRISDGAVWSKIDD